MTGGPPADLGAVPRRRRSALLATDAVLAAALTWMTAAHLRPPPPEAVPTAVVLALAGVVAAFMAVPRVTTRDRDGSSSGTVIDMSGLFSTVAALVLPVVLVPLAVLPSFAVDRWWARRPLYAVVVNALVYCAVAQGTAVLRDAVAGAARAADPAWAAGAWAGCLLVAVVDVLWGGYGRWLIRGVPLSLRDTLPDPSDAATPATAVLVATLYRISPAMVAYAVPPVVVLHQLLHFRQVQLSARTDGKTGLLNYRYFAECAQRELRRARRQGAPLTLLVVDMDRLRDVNNTYGHQAGDVALAHVVAVLDGHTREEDLVCRFGGEEFLVLLPGVAQAPAAELADRLRAAVCAGTLSLGGDEVRVSVSIGVAALDADMQGLDALVALADERVYLAKTSGRNRVVSAGPGEGAVVPAPRAGRADRATRTP